MKFEFIIWTHYHLNHSMLIVAFYFSSEKKSLSGSKKVFSLIKNSYQLPSDMFFLTSTIPFSSTGLSELTQLKN